MNERCLSVQLRRELGLIEVAALAASMMLGVGIFFGPSLTAREFPHAPTVLAIWTVGGVIAMCGAWLMGRLGGALPRSGGPYAYMREAFGDLPAFLFAWTSFVIIAPTSLAVLARLFAANLDILSPLTPRGGTLMALWSLVAFAFVNVIGVKVGGRVQSFATALKVVLVVGVIAIVFLLAPEAGETEAFAGGGRLSLAFVGVLFAFGGWEYAVLASEEVRDPTRTIPRGLLLGTAVVTVLYLAVTAAYLVALGADGVATSIALAPDSAARAGRGFAIFVALAVALSAAGTINAIMLLGPRATFAAARDGLAPASLARVSAWWGTPVASILVQVALASVYLLVNAFERVAAYTVIGTGTFIAASSVAFVVLQRRAGRAIRPMEWIALAVVGGAYVWFIVYSAIQDPWTAIPALALIGAGAVPYAIVRLAAR